MRLHASCAYCAFLLASWAVLPTQASTSSDTQFESFVGALTAVSLPQMQAYHRVFNYSAQLPKAAARNALVYAGHGRMRAAVQKALSGQPLSVGMIGGSISCGHGIKHGTEDWFTHVENYLRTAFPAAAIKAKNGCVPAVMSEYVR